MAETWTHRPEVRTVEIGEVGDLTDADLAAMTGDELSRRKIAVERALFLVKSQIKNAQNQKFKTGVGWDPAWFRSAMNARSNYTLQAQLIAAEFTRRRGGTKTERKAAIHRAFVNVAKEKLSPEVFQMWLDEAVRGLKLAGEREDLDVDQTKDARLRRLAHENYEAMRSADSPPSAEESK